MKNTQIRSEIHKFKNKTLLIKKFINKMKKIIKAIIY